MKTETDSHNLKLAAGAILLALLASAPLRAPAQAAVTKASATPAQSQSEIAGTEQPATTELPPHAQSYYHMGLAAIYEEDALSNGKSGDVTRAIEEYKLALNGDPNSPELNNSLAELYFHAGRAREAETTARNLLKVLPDNIDAHKLLGRIYLRQLGEGQTSSQTSSSSGTALSQAISEYETIVSLEPKNVEDRMVLGQLYTVKHDSKKAEEQFQTAQAIEPESEDVVLNLARLYAESGDVEHSVKVMEAVPAANRSARIEFALGAAYSQLKQPKDAIAAYKRAVDIEPGDLQMMDALAQALVANNQLDEALKQYRQISDADPDNADALVHIGEILRRQGKYEEALAQIRKARNADPTSLEAGYNEGLLLDVLGRFDEAAKTYQGMVDKTSHANGAYTDEEKNNRGIFLERLAGVLIEENKIDEAVDAFQKMIEMGGDTAVRGYQEQAEAYREAKQFDKAIEVSRKAVAAQPKNRDLKLLLASQLADQGHADEGLAMVRSLLDNSSADRAIWIALGQMNIRLHRWKDAEEAFNKAEPMSTKKEDRITLLFMRGELAERQKHLDPAESYFRQVLDLDSSNAMTLNYLGYMLADKGIKLQEALQMIRKAVEQEPMNGAYLDSLGWVYFKLGDYELAEDNLRRAVERNQTDPTVHSHLGDLFEKTGRIRLAAAQWQISLTQFNKSASADVEPSDVAKVQKKLESARMKLAREDNSISQPNAQ
jgi:tetratricopeptide (TPR) repeat protein